MAGIPLITDISSAITAIFEAAETVVDQAVIDKVKHQLSEAQDQMDASRFKDVHMPTSGFGDTAAAANLGYHHTKAHEVITDTLQGVLLDLERFRTGIVKAETLLADADTSSASDLKQKQQATEMLAFVPRHSQGDRRNHESRNENLPTEGGNA